ncbi:MAG: NAD-dependent epimerase/dehydratase family protein [Phycisphaeraceae bacterium]
MSDWFVMQPADQPLEPARKVFVTGAPGRVGRRFTEGCHDRYELTLMAAPDEDASHVETYGPVVRADLTEKERLVELMRGHDAVVHLAANPHHDAPWDELLAPNIVGCHHGFAAAHEAGVRRVVYASSVNAVGAAAPDHQVQPNDPVTPGNLYGATKAFGEALARYYAEREGMACYPIRIGAFRPPDAMQPRTDRPSRCDVSWRDLNQLICACLDTTRVRFAIVHAASRNDREIMCLAQVRELFGYEPEDDFRVMRAPQQ